MLILSEVYILEKQPTGKIRDEAIAEIIAFQANDKRKKIKMMFEK